MEFTVWCLFIKDGLDTTLYGVYSTAAKGREAGIALWQREWGSRVPSPGWVARSNDGFTMTIQTQYSYRLDAYPLDRGLIEVDHDTV